MHLQVCEPVYFQYDQSMMDSTLNNLNFKKLKVKFSDDDIEK